MTTEELVIGLPGEADLDLVVPRIAKALGLEFEERESGHYGGSYYLAKTDEPEELRVFRNYDPTDGQPFYADATDAQVVMRMFFTPRDVDALLSVLQANVQPGARVLRRR